MEITRNYSHRTFGAIGSVTLDETKGKWSLNGTALPEASVAHLMTFALQTLQDAYAGAKNVDEAKAAFEAKRDKLIAGTLGQRAAGDGATERTRVARSIVRKAVKAKFGSKSPEWAKFTGLDDAAQNEKLDAWFTANATVFEPEVDAEMARRAEAAAAKMGFVDKVDINL